MALPLSRQPLVADRDPQRLAQRVDHVDRRGVVVGARRPGPRVRVPVLEHEREVEVPRAAGPLARLELGQRTLAGGERRQAGRAVQALLCAGERRVDAGLVDPQRVAAQRRDAVDQQQRVVLATPVRQALERLRDAGRGLAVDDDDRGRPAARGGLEQLLDSDRAAPVGLDLDDVGAGAAQLVGHAHAEQPVDAADDAVAGVDEVRDERLHPRAAGPGDRQGRDVLGLEGLAHEPDRLAHDRREGGIHVADRRLGQRGEHLGRDRARARAQQEPVGDFGQGRFIDSCRHGASSSGKLVSMCRRMTSRIQRFSSVEAIR